METGSVSLAEIEGMAVETFSGSSEDPFSQSNTDVLEREIIHSNRVKLTDYIHDPTMLFPYMKESDVFSVYDCEVIKGEPVAHNRVDKFIDVLLTKGPRAIGVFHEALGKTYPGLFDYFTRLFTSKGIDLPEARRMRPANQVDLSEGPNSYEENCLSANSRISTYDFQDDIPWKNQMRTISRRGMTVRRSLDLLSKQLETIQTERNELKNSLSEKEKEISDLLKSKEKNHDDLLSITQHYQDLYKELLHLRESLSVGGSHRIQMQELVKERESIQAEYDALENDYTLVQLELRAARERISRLMGHLERSEQLVAFAQEERDALQHKVGQLEGELQRAERKQTRFRIDGSSGKNEIDALHKQMEKLQKDIEQSRNESVDLAERLKVARHERNQALDEKDEAVKKLYLEDQARKKAEMELKQLRKYVQQLKDHDSQSSDGSFLSYPTSTPSEMMVEMEDFTTVLQVSDDMGMKLGLGVIVAKVDDGGLAARGGLKNGDQLFQVNHIDVTSDRDPLDLCQRLLHNASSLVTLLIRRPVIVSKQQSGQSSSAHPHTLPSRIKQVPASGDVQLKSATFDRFQLSLNPGTLWSGIQTSNGNSESFGFVSSTPTSVTTPSDVKSEYEKGLSGDFIPDPLTEPPLRPRIIHSKTRHIDSDDGQCSIKTSSSEENSEHVIGLIQSPVRKPCSIFSDMPGTITRLPTLGFEDGDELNQSLRLDDAVDKEGLRPIYRPLISSPATLSPQSDVTFSPTSIRRQKAKKWQQGQRRSQSLVDMPDLDFQDPTTMNEIEMLQMKRIVIPWGKLGEGISLVGGRGRGLFFHTAKADNRGLQDGDQLIKIGSVVVGRMTYADVITTLEDYCKRGEQCMITVHTNKEDYAKLPSPLSRDDFYVRALYNYSQQLSTGELTFSRGEIFHVFDTLPGGKKDCWQVRRVNMFGVEEDEGTIPLVHKMSALVASAPSSFSSSLPTFFRNAFIGRRIASHTGTENFDVDIGRCAYDLYQPVCRVKVHGPRPVIVLGVGGSEVITALLDDTMFSLPPICTLGSLAMVEDQCSAGNIILKRTGENIRYCKVVDVISIANEDQYCLLPIEPSQLKNTSLSNLYPIVVFLHTSKPNHLSKMKAFRTNPDAVAKYLQEMKSLQNEYMSFFTCMVEVSGQMENVVKQVRFEIKNQQKCALWEEDN